MYGPKHLEGRLFWVYHNPGSGYHYRENYYSLAHKYHGIHPGCIMGYEYYRYADVTPYLKKTFSEKFPPLDDRQQKDIAKILESLIHQPIKAPTQAMTKWIEQIIADYLREGPIKAYLTLNAGPEVKVWPQDYPFSTDGAE